MKNPSPSHKAFDTLAKITFVAALGLIGRQVYDLHQIEKPAQTAAAPQLTLPVPCGLPGGVVSICQTPLSPEQFSALQRPVGSGAAIPQEARQR